LSLISSLFPATPIPKSIKNINVLNSLFFFAKKFEFNIKASIIAFLYFLFVGSLWSHRSLYNHVFSINFVSTQITEESYEGKAITPKAPIFVQSKDLLGLKKKKKKTPHKV